MISRLIILFIFILQSLLANQFEKSSTKIIDIGSVSDVQAMEVPAEWVWYDGPSTQIPWATVLEKRVESTESCITDNLHRENCPIDATVCDGSQQIDNGIIAADKSGRTMAHSICGQVKQLDGSYAQLFYNPSSGFCERVITTSYSRLDTGKQWVGIQGKNYYQEGSFTPFSFTLTKKSRFGPAKYATRGGSDHWVIVALMDITKDGVPYMTWQYAGSSRCGSTPGNLHVYKNPCYGAPGYRILEPGTYKVTFRQGGVVVNTRYGYAKSFSMFQASHSNWDQYGFMLITEPCADGGALGSPANPPPKTNVNKCYQDTLVQEKPLCPSGFTKTTPDQTCANSGTFDSYHCSKDPSYGSGNTLGPIECKKDYTWHNYGCKSDRNIYDYPWEGPALTHFDCKGECGSDGCTCEDIRPQNNCWRGMYTCPINPTQLCTKVVFDGECPDGETVKQIEYKPLDTYAIIGNHRESEFGRTAGYHCGDECGMNLEWIEGRGDKICVGNALGESSCFEAVGCSLSGRIDAGFDGKKGRYLSGFFVNSDLKSISKATRTWQECDSLLNCTLHSESIAGAITSSCEILGSVGNSRRLGGITSVSSDDRKLVFWDSYQDGEIGSLEIVPKIPINDQQDGFDYQNDKAAALIKKGFSAIYELDGKTYALSGSQISASQCAAAEVHGFYRENSNAKATIRVPDPTRINLPSGNSWCLLARDGSHSFAKQELSIRTIVHEACNDDGGKTYDATPLCSKGTLNEQVPECVEKTISTYNAKADCDSSIAGVYFDEQEGICKYVKTTTTNAVAFCDEGELVDGSCKIISQESVDATLLCDDGYIYNQTLDKCQKENYCENGVLNTSSGKCEQVETVGKILKPSACKLGIDFTYKIEGNEDTEDEIIQQSDHKEIETGTNATISVAGGGSCNFVSSGLYGCNGTIKAVAGLSQEQSDQGSITAFYTDENNNSISATTTCNIAVSDHALFCPDGYTDQNSTLCQKIVQTNPITLYKNPSFTCDVLYIQDEEDGEKYPWTPADDDEAWELDQVKRTCTFTEAMELPTNYECTGGGEYDGETSCLHYSNATSPAIYSCVDIAHTLQGDQCNIETNKIHEPAFVCPDGGNLSGRKCIKESIPVTHFCSPYTCNDSHLCRVADCAQGYTGSIITDELATNYPDSCIDQRCDAWLPYIPYCGQEHGCPPGTVTSTDGCYQMNCVEGEFDLLTGRCKQWGCPEYSAPKDGKCWR